MSKRIKDGRSYSRETLENLRFRAIELYQEGKEINEIAHFFGIHRGSVSRWITIYKRKGKSELKRKKAKGAGYKLSQEEIKVLLNILKDNAMNQGFETPLWTCKRVQQIIFKKFEKKIHTTNVMRLLRKLNLSPQKPERMAFQRNKSSVRKWLKEELPKIKKHRRRWQAMLYFQDESGVSLIPVLGRTWAPKGKTPLVKVTGTRGGLCVTSAISPVGKMIFRIENGKTNSKSYLDFLQKIIMHHKNRKVIIVSDNFTAHTSRLVRGFVESNKNRFALYYLPSYAPDLNPDEHVWCYLKSNELKTHQAQNTDELKKLVKRKMLSIQKKKELIHSFFSSIM